jgi:hypothetical protein
MCIHDHHGNFIRGKAMCYSPLFSVKDSEILELLVVTSYPVDRQYGIGQCHF